MKTALIYNFAQHYRTNIFTLMDKEMDIDFYFGDHYLNVKKMDYSLLSHKVTEVRNLHLGPFCWQTGVVSLAFKKYDTFIMLGEPFTISSWMLMILSRLMGKRVFFWSHGWYGKETRLKALIKKAFFGLANGTMLYGNYAKGLMVKEGLNADKLTVIHNSLMYDRQIEIRKSLHSTDTYREHFGNSNPVVVFVGRLTQVKKLHQILQAQAICNENASPFNLIFIGDGEEMESLQKETVRLGLEKQVWFYGPSYDETELSQLLYDADICVAPGNIGLTAMHAMAYGCPCISHNDFKWQMPEFEAIKEGVTGTFFQRDNVESLADSIKKWIRQHSSQREEVRKACFKEIDEEWNPHVQLERIKGAIK